MVSGNNSPLLQESSPYHPPTNLPTDYPPSTHSNFLNSAQSQMILASYPPSSLHSFTLPVPLHVHSPSLSQCNFNWFRSLMSLLLKNNLNHEHHNKNLNNSTLALPLPMHNRACFKYNVIIYSVDCWFMV